jgi:SprB repeat
LHLTVNFATHNSETQIVCDSVRWHGILYQSSGNYLHNYTNASNCASTDTLHLTVINIINTIITKQDILCFGDNSGTITALATGSSSITYTINGPTINTTGVITGHFTNLHAGNYSITATSTNGCTSTVNEIILQPSKISISVVKQPIVCLEENNAALDITATGGTGSLLYSIDGGLNYYTSGLFSNLQPLVYSVRIKDASNCTMDTMISLLPIINYWLGTVDGNWHNSLNWSRGEVPSGTTHVVIEGTALHRCAIIDADAFAASVRVNLNAVLDVATGKKLHILASCATLP